MTEYGHPPSAGVADTLEPNMRRLLAPNPSPMTYWGTNTYLLGRDEVVVIDPGPDNKAHLSAIMSNLAGARVTHILVTHAHLDHSPLAARLSDATDAPILAFGSATAGRRPVMEQLAAQGLAGGGEGIDADFEPHITLTDGQIIDTPAGQIEAVWTPGHLSNHLSFGWNGVLFTGDHVMGWASSLVSPPDGDLTAFMDSCAVLLRRDDRMYYPAHGPPIEAPRDRVTWLVTHRRARETSILSRLGQGPATAGDIARDVYTDTPPALLSAATRNVLAHLIDLTERGVISCIGPLRQDAVFARPLSPAAIQKKF